MIQPDTLPNAVLDALAEGVAEARPDPDRAEALKSRLLRRVRQAPPAGAAAQLITVRADEGWQELLPKIHAKRVYTDGWAESYLVRLEPGCCAPPHAHPADEECVVIEGELTIGDIRLRAGDFHVAHRGSCHGETRTDTGALVMLRYAAPLAHFMQI